MLKRIFENEDFILYQDDKGYDFKYDIENKRDTTIYITLTDEDETIRVYDWVGLFEEQRYIIDSIMNNNYEIIIEREVE